jgi:oxalate decarboxylase/phosphoglucose isomerase-like protein (cupin superfamily)
MNKSFAERNNDKMKEVLMDPNTPGPDTHYYMIRGGKEKTNITVMECGLVGNEYIKTYGHYHVGNISETYTILQGTGIIILQKRKIDTEGSPIDNEIDTFKAISVKAGDKIFIESEIGHSLINTGNIWLVTSDDSPVLDSDKNPISMPGHADYEPIKKMGGFAYYLIEKDNVPTLVKNPKYINIPEASIE